MVYNVLFSNIFKGVIMLRYADKVFEHFNFTGGIKTATQDKNSQQLYISGKLKPSTLLFFAFIVLVFTMSKMVTRLKMGNWNTYCYNNDNSSSYKKITNIQ